MDQQLVTAPPFVLLMLEHAAYLVEAHWVLFLMISSVQQARLLAHK